LKKSDRLSIFDWIDETSLKIIELYSMGKPGMAEVDHQQQHFFIGRVGRMGTSEKASRSTLRNREPGSNVTEVSDRHRRKQLSHKISTDAGITISINPLRLNTCFSIRDNLDHDSNVSEVSDSHRAKQPSPKTSTDAGTTISTKPLS
jgi:hypothetical protein